MIKCYQFWQVFGWTHDTLKVEALSSTNIWSLREMLRFGVSTKDGCGARPEGRFVVNQGSFCLFQKGRFETWR
jgi:hypothetical protein